MAYCRDCGIRFLTHPRNAGRQDLRCPFGCRQHHRRQGGCQRSTAYYQTAAGKRKKKRLNARRPRRRVPPPALPPDLNAPPALPPDLDLPGTSPPEPAGGPSPLTIELRLEGVVLDESSLASSPMLPHVRMIVSLIEGIELTCCEVVCLLRQAMRQHSIGARRRIDYLLDFLHRHPP